MDMEFKYGKMVQNMREIGDLIRLVDMVNSGMLMEMFSRENGLTIKLMDMEFMFIRMELDTRESGKMICNMGRVKRYGLIIQCMKVITMKVKNMVKVCIFGKTDQATMEIGTKTE